MIDRIDNFLERYVLAFVIVFAAAGMGVMYYFRPDIFTDWGHLFGVTSTWTYENTAIGLLGPGFLLTFAVWFGFIGVTVNMVARELLNIARYW